MCRPSRTSASSTATRRRSIEPGAGVECHRVEQHDEARRRLRDDNGNAIVARCTYLVGLVVPMERLERHVETGDVGVPLRAATQHPVGDVAQRAVRSSQSGTDPVGHLAADGVVGVVHADQSTHSSRIVHHRTLRRCHGGSNEPQVESQRAEHDPGLVQPVVAVAVLDRLDPIEEDTPGDLLLDA